MGEEGGRRGRGAAGRPSRRGRGGLPASVTLNPGVGRGLRSPWHPVPGPGMWLLFPCAEERAGALPVPGTARASPLLPALRAGARFLGGFVERVSPVKVAGDPGLSPGGTLQGDPGPRRAPSSGQGLLSAWWRADGTGVSKMEARAADLPFASVRFSPRGEAVPAVRAGGPRERGGTPSPAPRLGGRDGWRWPATFARTPGITANGARAARKSAVRTGGQSDLPGGVINARY